jgi:hypothetical protein
MRYTNSSNGTEDRALQDQHGKPYTHANRAYQKFKKTKDALLDHVPRRDRLMIVLTGMIAVSTVAQYMLARSNNETSGKQVDKLLIAANRVGTAAESFSESASGINTGISDAVIKLNTQADKLAENAKQSSRLATDSEQANTNALEADRPWMGGTISVSNFSAGQKPSLSYGFNNSGKRPAKILKAHAIGLPLAVFPLHPNTSFPYGHGSTGFSVPGTGINSTDNMPEVTTSQMSLINSGGLVYFAFAEIEYIDLRVPSNIHLTRICVQYMPRTKTAAERWRNCDTYNDAD